MGFIRKTFTLTDLQDRSAKTQIDAEPAQRESRILRQRQATDVIEQLLALIG